MIKPIENHNNLVKKLERAGLSKKEAIVYAYLTECGGAFPSKIAQQVGLNRSTVYDILLNLSVKGLVNEIEKKNKLFYTIEKPNRLTRYVRSQITIAHDQLEYAERLVPELEGLFSLVENKPRVRYFEGGEGILSVYEDHISVDKPYEMLAVANAYHLEQFLPKDFFNNYRKTKERKRITTRGIVPDTQENRTFTDRQYKGFKENIVPQMRFISGTVFPYKGEITIYGDNKVSIVNMENKNLTGVIIEDQMIHDMMRMTFELAWKGAR